MTARNLFFVCLSVLMVVVTGTVMHAQDAVKTNEAAAEELKQELQAAPVVEAVAEPAKPSAVAGANPDAVETPAKVEAKPAEAAPMIEELAPAKAEAKPAEAAPVIEELAPAKVEAKPAEAAPVIEELAPAKVEEKPAAAIPVIEELAPAKVEGKPAAAAPMIEELQPAKAPEVVPPTAAPVVEAPAVVAPAEAPKVEALAPEAAVVPPAQAYGTPERVVDAKIIADMEIVRRQAQAKEAQKNLATADTAWKEKDYQTALKNYQAAVKPGALRDEDRARAQERIPLCEYQVALELMKAGRNAEALAKVTEASNRYPADKNLKKLKARASDLVATPEEKKGPAASGDQMTEEDILMMDGKKALADRDYAKARASFESVLAIDGDNREAMRYLKETGDRQFNSATYEREATAKKMSAQVRDTWNPAQYKLVAFTPADTGKVDVVSGGESIMKKMERIVIPEIEFRQANIHDVVDFLNKASVAADKVEQDPAKKGINIILNLNPAGGATATAPTAAPADPFGAEGAGGAAGAGGKGQSYEITFTARYITLLSAMKIITQVAGLKYRMDGNIVMIVPADFDPAQIEVRMYPVEPTFIERVGAAGSAMPARAGGASDVRRIEEEAAGGEVADLKVSFEKMGVRFPQGSSITYNSAIGKVIVGNTAENLAVFERLLTELNVVPKQVEIEARFVEVNETDLQELGLEWLLNDDWELATKNTGAFTPLAATQRIVANGNTSSGGFTRGLRFWGRGADGSDDTLDAGAGTLGRIGSVAGVLTNPELSVVLHALEQNGNADLLSAPKVTTRSGSEASIRVVTEYIYPTSFEVQGGSIGTGTAGASSSTSIIQETVVVPQDFATREVGVILTVLPEVSPDGNMINLTMTPSVVTEPEWRQYGSTIRRADGSTQELNMPQPFFKVRTLSTQISIYDGATVVMGGLITEDLRKVNDKIPVLGDIPLLGFLFRSQSERSIKKNLLIFVTAKLVDPAGKTIRVVEDPSSKPPAPSAMMSGGLPAPN
jgi:general secretion pathway protein D